MKKRSRLKSTMPYVCLISLSVLASSCGTTAVYTKEVSEELNEEKFDKRKDQRDAQFLVNAAEIYMEQIGLAKLAQQKGSTSSIKELGRQLEEDHQNSLDELTNLARKLDITIPNTVTDQSDDTYQKLNKNDGDSFNEAYADLMVSKHEVAIGLFKKSASKSKDKHITEWANSMLVTLNNDLTLARKYQAEFED